MPAVVDNLSSKIQIAKEAGYSEGEILNYLGSLQGGLQDKIKTARNSEYKDIEIVDYLSKPAPPTKENIKQGSAGMVSQLPPTTSQVPDFKSMVQQIKKPIIDLSGNVQTDVNYFTKPMEIPVDAPGWAKKYPKVYTAIVKAKDIATPSAQALAYYGGMSFGPVGAGGMNALEQGAERLFDTAMGRREPLTLRQDLLQYAKDFAWGKTFGDIEKHGATIKDYLPSFLKRPSEKAIETEKQARKIGVKLLSSEVKQSKSLAILEGGMGRLLGSASILNEFDKKNIRNIITETSNIVNSSGQKINPEDLGRIIYDKVDDYLIKHVAKNQRQLTDLRTNIKTILGSTLPPVKLSEATSEALIISNKAAGQKARELYAIRDALLSDSDFIPQTNTIKASEKWLDILSKQPAVDRDPKLLGRLLHISRNWGWKGEDAIPYQEIANIKSNIGADLRLLNPALKMTDAGIVGLTKSGASTEVRAYSELFNSIERDLNSFARAKGGGLLKAARDANTYYGQFKKLTEEIRGLLKTNPALVLDKIDDIADVRVIKKAIGQTQFDKLIKPEFTNRILGNKGRMLDPEYSKKIMQKYANTLPEVYNKTELQLLDDSINKGIFIASKPLNKVDFSFMKKLVESRDPKFIIDSFYTSGKSKYAAHNFNRLYKISDTETRAKMRYFLSEKILLGGQKIDPASLLTGGREYSGFSFSTLTKNIKDNEYLLRRMTGKDGFTDEVIKRMKRIVNVGKYMQSSGKYAEMTVRETGQSTWALSQAISSLSAIITGNIPLAMGIIFGPSAVAKVYLSDIGRSLAIHGIPKTGLGTYGGLMITRPQTGQDDAQAVPGGSR